MEDDIRMLRELIALRKETIAEKEAQIGCSNPAIFRTLQVCGVGKTTEACDTRLHFSGQGILKVECFGVAENEARSTERRRAVQKYGQMCARLLSGVQECSPAKAETSAGGFSHAEAAVQGHSNVKVVGYLSVK